ncbi:MULTISPECIES: hormogonium polysaccharide biosynthesis protein HpsA [unclassified Nostoc]|uniref:hormogonium polysaccharide biosynthesis protein HpsA n=1 Tax=unclassified Nostoc TaxID=2593658 RepID=UPI002AD231FA|nr:hormogonium polysaccharide biosynthesis protein HpsA [Nostoc sp. DedQUE03]MDZ7972832.1 hormogonium polysaccharide biosynthesis protein HpsA [Nostoc sp. DedQUE03]MDZ8045250.1 hormogonium polysaccharide biosynthesis protein HpsA [Nostoc sp. DedQUE02]
MTKRKYIRAFTRFLRQVIKLQKTLKTSAIRWLARVLRVNFQRHQGGFVLPTTVMLLLIVTLVVSAIIFRTFSRSSQVISERQQQIIYNAATPAVDRAKAKLEYLFRQDTRLPAGVASDSTIQSILATPASGTDIYTLPGETRLANFQDSNSNPGIGWYFTQNNQTIAYSIIFKKQATSADATTTYAEVTNADTAKAPYFVVRNGPVNTNKSTADKCGGAVQLAANEKDWQPINAATLAKTFQVNAFVVANPDKPNRTVTTLELQQDRQVDKGNKWGAYFRYDFEVAQDPNFRWNGAIHSDGNMFFGSYSNPFKSYLISSPSSCVNTSASDSKVTVSSYTDTSGATTFQGQIVAGRLSKAEGNNGQQFGGSSTFDLFNGNGNPPTQDQGFGETTDSVTPTTGKTPADMALDPVALLTQDVFKARGSDTTNTTYRDTAWTTRNFFTSKRIFNEETNPPYLDDTYRADDRYGPNPTYDGKPISTSLVKIPSTNKVGEPITSSNAGTNYDSLTRNTPPDPKNPDALGLDGYWERRAVTGGLRVIVGQRLELGDPLGTASSLPSGRQHEFLQRRTQRDNLAAVQATSVYHYQSGSGLTPVACMATTVHPGTAETLRQSATFDTLRIQGSSTFVDKLLTDFFTGRGTNGWEFSSPPTSSAALTALSNARANLAYFAGDPDGAFPPKQEASTSTIMHPYPELTKYGNFSNLRRSLSGTSIADQSYRDTANCMLGMLAYNISYLNGYDYSLNWSTAALKPNALLDDLDTAIANLSPLPSTPDQAIAALNASAVANKDKLVKLARLIATKEQVELDRRNGATPDCGKAKFRSTSPTDVKGLDILCPSGVKYNALYYIFPTSDHAEDRTDSYITGATVNPTSVTDRYKTINIADIAITPNIGTWTIPRSAAIATNDTNIATIPGQPGSLPNSNTTNYNNLVKYTDATPNTTYYQVAFKDAALFNGREMMSVRALDVDLNLLRSTTGPGTDKWLPINDNTATDPNAPPPNGIFYAFREDAVREDGIARPAGASNTTNMNAQPGNLKDPLIDNINGISTKSVDYYADPDRRPYGFRLKNGSRLDRGTNTAGMSFISNNSVYIQGDFNLHSTDGTTTASNLLEEFANSNPSSSTPDSDGKGKLKDDWSNFYLRTRKDTRFASPSSDTWRPTEVLGDDVNILSNQFCNGSIEDGIIYPGSAPSSSILSNYGCSSSARYTSYLNQNRPKYSLDSSNIPAADRTPSGTTNTWIRANPYDSTLTSPIDIDPNGKPRYCKSNTIPCPDADKRSYENVTGISGDYPHSYLRFQDQDGDCNVGGNRKCIGTANTTRVNTIIVQGIIPSRGGQSYGGFHVFPRMFENWDSQDFFLSGAFIQLRFSNQATGNFDQEAWEPGNSPSSSTEYTWYFRPPSTRRWGYDVALQFQTGGPVSRRFAVPSTNRSEVYRELAVDDPYIKKLRCAKKSASGPYIDPAASCS